MGKGVLMHVQKCGGQTLKAVLYGGGNSDRYDCVTLLGPLHHRGGLYFPRHRWEIKDWDERFKFAVIRNPFARLPSLWRHFHNNGVHHEHHRYRFQGTFSELVDIVTDDSILIDPEFHPEDMRGFIRAHGAPLSHHGYCLPLLDYVGRFEDGYEHCLGKITEGLGRPIPANIPHVNKTTDRQTPHYSTYYSHADREKAEHYYWRCCELYDYKFEEAA